MTAMCHAEEFWGSHPIDVIEQMILAREWVFDRNSDHELAARVPGRWCDYNLFFAWNEDLAAMHFSCAFDMRIPFEKRIASHDLIQRINGTLWLGHFCLWPDEGQPVFRHVLPLRGSKGPAPEQIDDLLSAGVEECERFFPAFQFVVWGGKSPQDAIDAAMIDTVGEA